MKNCFVSSCARHSIKISIKLRLLILQQYRNVLTSLRKCKKKKFFSMRNMPFLTQKKFPPSQKKENLIFFENFFFVRRFLGHQETRHVLHYFKRCSKYSVEMKTLHRITRRGAHSVVMST